MFNLETQLGPGWLTHLESTFNHPKMIALGQYLLKHQTQVVPPFSDIFKAYELVQPEDLKVLILGQDPYPTPGVAHGLAFSYQGKATPASLRVIFKELQRDGFGTRTEANLTDWAKQGVMLLNTVLTTEIGKPYHHSKLGWDILVAKTLEVINRLEQPYVVMAWGMPAKDTITRYIMKTLRRLLLAAPHPMAEQYSGGRIKFTGCGHFSACNTFLEQQGIEPISWN